MSTSPQGFIAAAPPSRIVRAPVTTLFDLAARFYGNQLQWTVIAQANGLTDPWLTGAIDIKIPNIVSTIPPTGILGSDVSLIRVPVEIDTYFGYADQSDALDQALQAGIAAGAEGFGEFGGRPVGEHQHGASPMLRRRAGWPKHGASPSLRRRAGWTEPGVRHAFRPRSPTEAADAAEPPGTDFRDRDKAHAREFRSPVSPSAFYQSLIAKGFSKNAAAGLTGNAIYESGGDINRIWLDPPTGPQTGDAAHGAMQWEGVRKQGLRPTLVSHVNKIHEEISSGSQGLSIGELNAARSPEEAAALVNRKYERPQYPGASESQRQAYARRVRQMGGDANSPTSAATPEMAKGHSKDRGKFRVPGSDAYSDFTEGKPKISSKEMGELLQTTEKYGAGEEEQRYAHGEGDIQADYQYQKLNELLQPHPPKGQKPVPGIDIEPTEGLGRKHRTGGFDVWGPGGRRPEPENKPGQRYPDEWKPGGSGVSFTPDDARRYNDAAMKAANKPKPEDI